MLPARATIRAQKTRTAILESALELFRQKGFAATTMRGIAEKASLAIGASYYHFRTKDEIVFAFYESTQDGSEERAKESNARTNGFAARLNDLIEFKIEQLSPYREFLGQLASHALVPNSSLSPFSPETRAVRERAITLFKDAMDGSDLKIADELKPEFPRLLWLYQMGVILYWLHDTSAEQAQTKKLISISQSIVLKLVGLSRIPVLRPLNKTMLSLLELFTPDSREKKARPND